MNIQTLIEKIELFERMIFESGFKRDIEEYSKGIVQPQNKANLIMLKETVNNIITALEKIYDSDLLEALEILLTKEDNKPFTKTDHISELKKIIDDPNIDTNQFFDQLNNILNTLKSQIDKHETELNSLKETLKPYVDKEQEVIDAEKYSVIAIIFKDRNTISRLKEFSKTLNRWNRALHIYHQIITSVSPEEIKLVEIQNGSIDVIVNIDVNFAVNFVELVKLGLEVFGGYLLYKSTVKKIVKTYFGNEKLIKSEKEREKEMLENIGTAIKSKILEQHEEAKKSDKQLKSESIDAKANDVTNVLTEHIVKGNDLKLLAAPSEKENLIEESKKMKRTSFEVRKELQNLDDEDKIKLIEMYSPKDDD